MPFVRAASDHCSLPSFVIGLCEVTVFNLKDVKILLCWYPQVHATQTHIGNEWNEMEWKIVSCSILALS